MASHIAIISMARWFVATRGRALATASLGYSVSEMTFPFIFVFLMTLMAWQYIWVICAGICVLAALCLHWMLLQERVPGASEMEDNSRAGMNGRHWTRKETLGHPTFWFFIPGILGLPAFGTAVLFHQVHYAEIKDITHLALVSLLPVYSSIAIASMVVSGFALDRFGTLRLLPFFLIPVCFAFVLFATATSIFGIALGFVFFGMTTGAHSTLTNAFWAEIYGTAHIGAIKSLATAIMVLGSAIGPAVTGILIDLGVGLDWQYLGIALYFLIAAFSIWFGIGHVRKSLTETA